jgi:hypothetical protein
VSFVHHPPFYPEFKDELRHALRHNHTGAEMLVCLRHCDETLVLDWYFFGVIDHE